MHYTVYTALTVITHPRSGLSSALLKIGLGIGIPCCGVRGARRKNRCCMKFFTGCNVFCVVASLLGLAVAVYYVLLATRKIGALPVPIGCVSLSLTLELGEAGGQRERDKETKAQL